MYKDGCGNFRKQVYDGVLGLAVGDALGVPVEFMSRQEISRDSVSSMRGYGTHGQPVGTWSDDTSLTLALMDSIDSYRKCVLKAVNLGDDTDTVGAVAGGLAGIYYGYEEIPCEWLNVLVKRKYIEDLCEKLRVLVHQNNSMSTG